MVSEALKPNVQDLQQDVIELLGEISTLMNRASTALSSDGSSEKYAKFQQEVTNAARNVEDLELRMAIVAPMKAGKSTIINSIIGQEILPSRNTAMTTLPTEIVLNAKLTEPTLTLNPEILSVFQETHMALRDKMQELGSERTNQKIAQYPHLANLLQKIQNTDEFPVEAKASGVEEIKKTLTDLNDIIRLCSLIEPSKDPLGELIEVPRIETPFWTSQKNDHPQMLGNLVIVDTPGPNEAGENLRLAAVVREQLQKSAMVLIVLDFTMLKTKAAEEVKQEVQKVIQLQGKENLYILINKVDQRTDGDMTFEQVRQFVAAEFEISDSDNTNRVFEVSARRALSAANFIQEREQYPNLMLDEMQTARSLSQQVFGIDWEDELQEATPVQLGKKAERLWTKSGFTPFLDKAINTILEKVAPRCLRSALKLSLNRIEELSDDINVLKSAIEQDETQIRSEIDALKADIVELDTRRDLWQPKVESILENLKHDLDKYLTNINVEFSHTMNQSNLKPVRPSDSYYSFKEMNGAEIRELEPTDFTNIFLGNLYSNGIKELEFESEDKAYENSRIVADCLKEFIEFLLNKIIEDIEYLIEYYQQELDDENDCHPQEIIKKAQQRIEEKFNIILKMEPPNFKITAIDDVSNLPNKAISVSNYSLSVRFYNYFMRLFKSEQKTIKENRYRINLKLYLKEVNRLINKEVKLIEKEVQFFMEDKFTNHLNQYFQELKEYLGNYQSTLEQAIKEKKLSAEDNEARKHVISSLIYKSEKLIKPTNEFLASTNQLLCQ